ncbi:amidohydrolase family protein [Muricauda sp. HICW]|uniref:Amidohydrolase family protein n=1 Tax=Flagellimonas chongwuensis TaxID=2697365 RepID=A0A850NKZ9_9FLAO|nr:amidohydrolase family protein [Allomuricauda chongwuensis]NVN19836.1 amidohydrolase family protein [Allomuricauda chongwuensis]
MTKKIILLSIVLVLAGISFFEQNSKKASAPYRFKKMQSELTRNVYSDSVLRYVKHNYKTIVLRNATIIDGTGAPAKKKQTIIVKSGKFHVIGNDDEVVVPTEAKIMNMQGKTIIPGLVGMHNHLHIPGFPDVGEIASKLYLAAGVTTIQTCGATDSEKELLLSYEIEQGKKIGPNIVPSAPFVNGPGGNPNMIIPKNLKHLKDTLGYWLNKDVKWIKVYRNVEPDDLEEIIDMAHGYGAKVRGHLCSVTFEEATRYGIDGIEHGLNSASDFRTNKTYGVCGGGREYMDELNIDDPKVKTLQQQMIDKGTFLTSTLSIYEASVPNRIYLDDRAKSVMSPYLLDQYERRSKEAQHLKSDLTREKRLQRIMAFDRQFHEMGGLLCSGVDAGRHIVPGFGDQRNFELLREAGFSTEEAIQVMTNNGAKALGKSDIGSIAVGKNADFVILDGTLVNDPSAIYKVNTVFKNGLGYDSNKLIGDLQGKFGL